jgi:uncharacterized protein (TIGR03435 family)
MRIALLLAICSLAFAQTPKLAFEVVSIKPAPKGTPNEMLRDGRLHNRGDDAQVDIGAIGLTGLIGWAFDVPADQVKGPEWMKDTNFDIVAKIPAGHSRKDVPEMLQAMLIERFKLASHREQKILPIYELKIASGGVKFKESAADESRSGNCRRENRSWNCPRIDMAGLAKFLTGQARTAATNRLVARWAPDRPVFDATGLTGEFSVVADWGPLDAHEGGDPDAETIVTAAQGLKALGLKLEPAKRAFDYVIIDHLERIATEN